MKNSYNILKSIQLYNTHCFHFTIIVERYLLDFWNPIFEFLWKKKNKKVKIADFTNFWDRFF